MSEPLCRFWREDRGQDLIEYSLLIAFIAMASISLFGGPAPLIRGLWTTANSTVALAGTSPS
jgi:Flp pilus assembly pilin Flp